MAYGIQFSTDMKKIGDTRLKSRGQRRLLATAIERASTFTITQYIANINAADLPLGWVEQNCVYLGGTVEISTDDDGTLTIEKWDDQSGSAQTAISGDITVDGGVSLVAEMDALVTTDIEVAAGYKINLLSATFDGSATAVVTLFFKTVDDVEGDDT